MPGEWPPDSNALIGLGVGVVVVALYLVGGILVAHWSLADFFARRSVESVGALFLHSALAVAVFGIPVAAFLRYRVVSPFLVLVVILVGWLVQGLANDILSVQTVFGLAVYAMYFSPLYLGLYLVGGWIEHRVRLA